MREHGKMGAARESVVTSLTFEELCQAGFENVAVGMAFKVLDGPFLRINQRYCSLLGYSAEELITRGWEGITHPDDLPRCRERLSALIRGEVPFLDLEKRFVRADGSTLWANVTVSPCGELENGKKIGLVVLQDIENRIKLKHDLEHSEKLFRFLAENMSDVVWILDLEAGKFRYVSPSVERLRGYTSEEVMEMSLEKVMTPESFERVRQNLTDRTQAIKAGKCEQAVFVSEVEQPCKDGSTVWVEVATKLLPDPESGGIEILGVSRDITERRRYMEQLRRSENRFRELIEFAVDGILLGDPNGNIIEANRRICEMSGYSREELLGRFIAILFEPDELVRVPFRFDDLKVGKTVISERFLRRKNGTLLPIEMTTKRMPDGSYQSFYRDVSERLRVQEDRRRFEAQMLQAQKLESLGVLAGGIAHDFNNLLLAILGNAELAQLDLPTEAPAYQNLNEILKVSHRAAELCRQMLAYSGKGRMLVESIDLSRMIGDMSKLLQVTVSKKSEILFELAPQLPLIDADASQVRQIVMNLLNNASEAIGDRQGTIRVRTGVRRCDAAFLQEGLCDQALPGDYVFIEVTDDGCGMDQATRARIFDPFFSTKFTGRGLGLAALIGIIKSHHGTVRVESEVGKGSSFLVLLPVSTKPLVTPVAGPAKPVQTQGKERILLVDDEEDIRILAQRVLQRQGFEVVQAADGNEAIRVFAEHQGNFDCVLLDLKMPKRDGIETFVELRKLRPDVNVILSSGYNEETVSERPEIRGIAGFLQKPYSNEELVAKVRFILQQREKQDETS